MEPNTDMLSLDEWYTQLAPLTEKQRISVSRVSAWVSESLGKDNELDEGTGKNTQPVAQASSSSTAAWISAVAAELYDLPNVQYVKQLQTLCDSINSLDSLVEQVETAQGYTNELCTGLQFVKENSQQLLERTGDLLKEQTELDMLCAELNLRLSYFSVLPRATAMIGSAAPGIVEKSDFLDTLKRLELALQFMSTHAQYADAQLYQMRIVHCLSRATSMIKHHFANVGSARLAIAMSHLSELKQTHDAAPSKDTLGLEHMRNAAYQDFASLQATFKPLFQALEQMKALDSSSATPTADADEFAHTLRDCAMLYCGWRSRLVKEALCICLERNSAFEAKQTVKLAHSFASLEIAMYSTFFALCPDDAFEDAPLSQLFIDMGEILQEFLTTHLDTTSPASLAALCNALQSMGALPCEPSPIGGEATTAPEDTMQRLAFALIQPTLQELSSRLVHSAQASIKSEIVLFKPTEQDLAYPACLAEKQAMLIRDQAEMARATRGRVGHHVKRESSVGAGVLEAIVGDARANSSAKLFMRPPQSVYQSWYAPVRTTLDLLAMLHTHISVESFADISAKCIQGAQESVHAGGTLLKEGKFGSADGGVQSMDGFLFELRHLFVLQELLYSVRIALQTSESSSLNNVPAMKLQDTSTLFGVRMVDVGTVLSTINMLWGAKSMLTYKTGDDTSTVDKENRHGVLDATYTKLNTSIMETSAQLCDITAASFALPLDIYLQSAPVPFSPEKANAAWDTFLQSMAVNSGETAEKLALYISDQDTAKLLLENIVNGVVQEYTKFEKNVQVGLQGLDAAQRAGDTAAKLASLNSAASVQDMLWSKLLLKTPSPIL
ncbi:Golgi transport complex subunit 3 [Malassezia vespertilionis]|uniref:Conserved oligomeric Golgi complex subunit 3 n=1 Tax=Malassezia vespertilionis TaxID=2020962 RepID=A0A2N1JHN4_9BASI|nr:Golgi transport complex subunit 3 [Malassezia vespertilionis]PKI86045.1 Cog3p [Malassezia vespertilionis]WFD05270.1 Golgi transport complex subunit 3 [Malassezia vespertilionis]